MPQNCPKLALAAWFSAPFRRANRRAPYAVDRRERGQPWRPDMDTLTRRHKFDPSELELIDRVYEVACRYVEARDLYRERAKSVMEDEGLRKMVFACAASGRLNFDTLCDKVLAALAEPSGLADSAGPVACRANEAIVVQPACRSGRDKSSDVCGGTGPGRTGRKRQLSAVNKLTGNRPYIANSIAISPAKGSAP
jgi:hypothetical protein